MAERECARRRCQLGLLLALIPALVFAQTSGAQLRPQAESPTAAIETLFDPSLRSTVSVPTVHLSAEIKEDTKLATAKIGVAVTPGWTAEGGAGFAFDREAADRRPSSLRRLTDGSTVWGAVTWMRPRDRRHPTPLVAARVEAGRDAFSYYDLALARHTDRHARFAVTATAGLILPRDILVAGSYRWSGAWQVADASGPCRVVAETGVPYCAADRLFHRPSPQLWQQFEAQVQMRLGDRIGAEVFVTRDLRDRAWGVEAPVYFMTRRDGGFTGGLVPTYNGATGGAGVSAFVGQAFRLFK